jgi:hypothetical protein
VLWGVDFMGSVDFELFLALPCHFAWFTAFLAFCWLLRFSFFYMTFLSFSLFFGSSSCASWDLGFEL